MAKIVCEKCETVFQLDKIKGLKNCPVCNEILFPDGIDSENEDNNEPLSFGDDIELGEFDSFDEDKIDFWWYEIDEPNVNGKTRGRVYTNCAKCGHLLGIEPYPIARVGSYLLIDTVYHDKCGHCGNEMKNHILSKRPETWVDPRKNDMWGKDYKSMIKCPICSSTKVHKISMTNKAASALAFGVLAAGHVSKTYKCDICKSKF